ncbi:recombinase RecT [Salmonella enterica subsp. houtenae]|nr:recombinase RecT [Salmonella enterica subsp. houtenae]ECE5922531.1 hypothetical protein [Salmonella enterica subsp. houtenae]EDR3241803.1 recombinase RecT [Salmonella enterica subsp. houtenae]
MSNDIAITSQPGATVGTAAAIFSPEGMDRLVRFATLMADSKATVPQHLAGKPADCLAVTMWEQDPRQQLAYLCVKRWARLHAPDVLLGVYTPDELQETTPRVERDITPAAATAQGMNSLINSKTDQKEQARNEGRGPDEILKSFTDAASNAESVEKLDLIFNGGTWPDSKKRPGAKDALSGKWLEMATDVYNLRRDELNEVPM